MKLIRTVAISFGAMLVLSACGTQEKDHAQKAPEATAEEAAERDASFAEIPAAAIVRVPVDAEGNPIGEPEMRVVGNGSAPASDEQMASAWSTADAPEALVDAEAVSELDMDSSTQSWSSWNRGHNNNCGYNRGGCYGNYNHNYFYNRYRPTLYTRGYSWNYQRGYNCRIGGYSYYSYSSYRYW